MRMKIRDRKQQIRGKEEQIVCVFRTHVFYTSTSMLYPAVLSCAIDSTGPFSCWVGCTWHKAEMSKLLTSNSCELQLPEASAKP
ncbi:hypothetical protein XELAEV_18021865mg [Xenopus laevis]|uniref:Uncharacterized protein n=1 Tax=Xenopus laevis TaxID=8355 RepID=A0A974D3M7_XENLA|nr:hypothetical protein XELAEV_18021865mg [Xenopus laevis]